jgi:fatty acid desaturase
MERRGRQGGTPALRAFEVSKGAAVARLGVAVVGMGFVALVVAYLFFGWPVLLVGGPVFVAIGLVVVAVLVSEAPRRRLEAHRATRFDPSAQVPGGLMSGFFEVGAPPRGTSDRRV